MAFFNSCLKIDLTGFLTPSSEAFFFSSASSVFIGTVSAHFFASAIWDSISFLNLLIGKLWQTDALALTQDFSSFYRKEIDCFFSA
jgi:hypothetical protein